MFIDIKRVHAGIYAQSSTVGGVQGIFVWAKAVCFSLCQIRITDKKLILNIECEIFGYFSGLCPSAGGAFGVGVMVRHVVWNGRTHQMLCCIHCLMCEIMLN